MAARRQGADLQRRRLQASAFEFDHRRGSAIWQRPVVTGTADGRFAVAWEDHSGGDTHIKGRVFNSDGSSPSGVYAERICSSVRTPRTIGRAGDRGRGLRRPLPGELVTAGGRETTTVYFRAYNAANAFSANHTFPVDINAWRTRTRSAVAGLTNGNYVIVWTDAGSAGETDGSGSHIRARIFAGNGAEIAGEDEFIVNSVPTGDQSEPAVAGSERRQLCRGLGRTNEPSPNLDICFAPLPSRRHAADRLNSSLRPLPRMTARPRSPRRPLASSSPGPTPCPPMAPVRISAPSSSTTTGRTRASEFIVNATVTAGNQFEPSVATSPTAGS